ncbi:MAG: phosphoglycerate kinase [Candidatus Aenigmarchaeota archaeon]|nr:phosphoglycerate kinase [Candidatus Aenigmarchaeota archaeon]
MVNYLKEIRDKNLFVSKHMHELSGKRVLIRIDTNGPVRDGQPDLNSFRVFAHGMMLEKYVEHGALPIILTHQGRKGDEEFIANLSAVARRMEIMTGIEIHYVDKVTGSEVAEAIKNMKHGEAVFLRNVRDHPEEESLNTKEEMVNSSLTKFFKDKVDVFINDSPSVCHRAQWSLVGFFGLIPSYFGLQMEYELEVIQDLKEDLAAGKKITFFVGGKKFEKIEYLKKILEYPKAKFCTGGLTGQYIAHVAGIKLNGENIKILEESEIKIAKELYDNFKDKIEIPVDYTLENREIIDRDDLPSTKGLIMDIGPKTVEKYAKEINGRCVFAGVMGVFEKGFDRTLELLRIASSPKTVIFGGHSSAALFQNHGVYYHFIKKGGKVITSGGSALALLADFDMPGLDVGIGRI